MTPQQLKTWRTSRGLTQKALAEKLGIDANHYQRLEYGKTPISTVYELALEALAKRIKPNKKKEPDGA